MEFRVTINTMTHSHTFSGPGSAFTMSIADFLEFTLNPLVKSCHDALVDDRVPGLSSTKPPYFFYQPQDKLMYLVVSAKFV
jgi:hypothetical protein